MSIKDNRSLMKMKAILTVILCAYLPTTVTCWNADWDHFVFAQAWPPGVCANAPRQHHTCNIAPNIHSWTIHGLWPSEGDTKGPTSCNSSMPFNYTQIAGLKADMDKYWPNLYNDTKANDFWAHEWTKHGTCCQDLAATLGEYNYFSTALAMNKKYNLLQMLSDGGVVPSIDAQYSYQQFIDAIKKVTLFTPVMQCSSIKLENGSTYHLIDQMQICLGKDFSPVTCNMDALNARGLVKPQSSCPLKYNFNYPPIQPTW